MSQNTTTSSGGIGFVGLLTIVFITLKLIGKIDWSWLWVLSPIWIAIGLVVGLFVGAGLFYVLVVLLLWPVLKRLFCRSRSTR